MNENLQKLAKDLTKELPRSPREKLAGYVIAARALDKCRATLAGKNGEYCFNCPLDQIWFDFAGIDADTFKDFVATGASDDEVADWIKQNGKPHTEKEIVPWNNEWRYKRISELPVEPQVFMEGYIEESLPSGRYPTYWFDVYDIEEKRV